MSFYHLSAEAYLLIGALASPLFCVLSWLLLGQARTKRLHSYIHWYLPAVIGGTFSAAAFVLTAFLRFSHARDFLLGSLVYLLCLAGVPFHIVSFARFWKTLSQLPVSAGDQPQMPDPAEQGEGVWPPQPRR